MKKIFAILSVLALSAPLALAADSGWYAGAGVGRTNFNGNELDLEPTNLANETYILNKLDKSSTGWKLFVGKQFNENWAVEGAFTKLGKFYFNATITSAGNASETAEAKPDCWSLSAVGTLPLGNNFSLLGRAGICHWADHPFAQEAGVEYRLNSSGNSLTYGVGAKYDFGNNFGVRAEWERFEKVVHDRASADLLSVSLQYGF
jgi:OOP family OmpA-OmpF porin